MEHSKKQKIRKILNWVLWLGGTLYTIRSHFNGCPPEVILGAWCVAPPVWFLIEYSFLFEKEKEDWETFRFRQSLFRNLWLGMVALLATKYVFFR